MDSDLALSGRSGDDLIAQGHQGYLGIPVRKRGQVGTSAIGATLDLGTSLLDDVVGAQLLEHVGQHRVVGQVGVEHLLQLIVSRVLGSTQHEGRQGRNLLAQIGARRLAGRR